MEYRILDFFLFISLTTWLYYIMYVKFYYNFLINSVIIMYFYGTLLSLPDVPNINYVAGFLCVFPIST